MAEEAAKNTLSEWAARNVLKDARLSEDGKTLELGGQPSLDATLEITVDANGKSCRYTLASIFLQIVDPDQGLVTYRNACKKHGVKDAVKAIDKPSVVGYFLPHLAAEASADAAPPPAEDAAAKSGIAAAVTDSSAAAAAAADSAKKRDSISERERTSADATGDDRDRERDRDHHHKSSRDRHHHRDRDRHRSSSSDHHHRSKSKDKHRHHGRSDRSSLGKKAKLSVTNEQMLENLNVVVGKREAGHAAASAGVQQQAAGDGGGGGLSLVDLARQEEITKALSADGFVVTPALIEENREATRRILSNEIPVGDSASILRAANPKKDLARVLELYNESIKPAGRSKDTSSGRGGGSSSAAAAAAAASAAGGKPVFKRKHLVGKKPIIVVPKGMTAPLTLINAHEFLCNGKFVPRDVMMKQGRQRSPATTFTRNVMRSSSGGAGGALLEYEIVDNPRKLGKDPREWERIVAVIVLGQSWQFKDWIPKYDNPVTLFSLTYGYYISMEGNKIPEEVNSWAVKKAQLNRDKRGLDSITYTSFWNGLDEFMRVHRPELLPQAET